ncbi:glutaredoxin-2, mitochondrial-like isoform X1 [Stegodyphus dumicola]|uniref:glutaredoxin-2, mitochondrial-like isoform X1 n=1 Tax=Stegodyphus dumicola TaxID=202533 RepID=UPI0015AF69EC|nr:glutaredoxin-2, mitochondrial-like isoform X1 [Stegodyphus dumicola]
MGAFSSSPQKLLYTAENKVIQDLINKNCVVVFSKTQCVYCRKVKKLFTDNNIAYLSIELDKRDDGNSLQNALHQITGARTVPRVFINGECIGGASESEKLYNENKLMEKISQCNRKQFPQ